jgi:hypothetical protein
MNEAATAAMTVDSPVLENHGAEIALRPDIVTPEAFQAGIERDKQMRKILRDYVKSEMKEGYHYASSIGGMQLAKPMLLQEGARNLCSLFKLIIGTPDVIETYVAGTDHLRVRAHVDIFNMQGYRIASGDGICSTREVKYAYRKGERICPNCGVPAIIKGKAEYGGGWVCFTKKDGCGAKFEESDESITSQMIGRVENPDIADLENTVLKMAIKRAKVGAVCDVPLVSEIFAPGDKEPGDDRQPGRGKSQQNGSAAKPAQQQPSAPAVPASIKRAVELSTKLVVDHKVEIEALAMQFLPEGVANFSDLTDEQAASVIPGLVDLLNSKINAK